MRNKTKLYSYLLSLYFLCLPLGALNLGAFGSALKFISVFPILVAFLCLKDVNFTLLKPANWYFAYALLAALSIFWSRFFRESADRALTFGLLFVLMFSASVFTYNEAELAMFKRSLAWSSRISVVLLLAFGVLDAGRLKLDGIITEDINYMCLYLSFGLINAIQQISTNGKFSVKLVSVVETGVYFSAALLTGSRGGTIALIFGCLAYVVFEKTESLSGKKLFVIIVVGAALYIGFNFLSDTIVDRFSLDVMIEERGAHRLDIWEQGINLFKRGDIWKKLFGYGTATTKLEFTARRYANKHVMHNMFLETLVELGITGLIIYVGMVLSFAKNAFKAKDRFAFAVIIAMIIMSVTASIYTFKPYINIMILILCEMRRLPDKTGQSNDKFSKQERKRKVWL